MNMFLYELKSYSKFTIIWTITLVLLITFFLSMYPSFMKETEEYKKLLESYPESILEALSINLDHFFSILGFYSYLFLYVLLCGSIQAMYLGTSIISKEEREKTVDFLFAKPVPRTKIMTAKLLAALVSLLITNILYLIGAFLMVSQVSSEEFSKQIFILISLSLFFIQLIFLSIGFLIAVIMKIKSVLTVSLTTVFSFFVISMLASITKEEVFRYFSPFQYFETSYIIENSSYELPNMILAIVIVIAAIVISFIIYRKKDIHV